MVGTPLGKPSLAQLSQGLDVIQALAWWLEHPAERETLRREIDGYHVAAERASVGNDLEAARGEAKRILADALVKAQAIVADADKTRAQAEEILAVSRQKHDEQDQIITSRNAAVEKAEAGIIEGRNALAKHAAEIDNREQELHRDSEVQRAEKARLEAWANRLKAASAGP